MKYITKLINHILNLNNSKKKILIASFDILNLFFTLLITLLLLKESLIFNLRSYVILFTISIIIGVPLFIFTGQYITLTRYIGSQSFYRLIIRNTILTFLLFFISSIFFKFQIVLVFWILYFLILINTSIFFRVFVRDILSKIEDNINIKKEKVVIYGATKNCIQIVYLLKNAHLYEILSIIDEDKEFFKRSLDNIPINSISYIKSNKNKIDKILIAKDKFNSENKIKLINKLNKFKIPIFLIPSISESIISTEKTNNLVPISIEDLLARDYIPPKEELVGPSITGEIVCVTGAGGSIGSELCRKIISLSPKQLIIIDNNEHSLYEIDKELNQINISQVKVYPILLNCIDETKLESIFNKFPINSFFHAAAYKHVHMIEENPLSGIQNNIFSTLSICKLGAKYKINSIVLISSDKAVRPTNVMGATKRISELIFQVFSKDYPLTKFSIVRFGNVLGSSGSVVPLFKEQIAKGGPITITHPEVIRYFMTIEEAALLVIQSNLISNSGDVLLLDMGKPIKIIDLAKNLIRLNGLTIKDKNNKDGDIEIKIIGLKDGEKLYEELLIDFKAIETKHPLIFKAREKSLSSEKLYKTLDEVKTMIENNQEKKVLLKLISILPEWQVSESIKNILKS